jgi:hypothetical protein
MAIWYDTSTGSTTRSLYDQLTNRDIKYVNEDIRYGEFISRPIPPIKYKFAQEGCYSNYPFKYKEDMDLEKHLDAHFDLWCGRFKKELLA